MTYRVRSLGPGRSRLLVKLVFKPRGPGALGRVYGFALPWGDLFMMRKQLHTLRDLAERDNRANAG